MRLVIHDPDGGRIPVSTPTENNNFQIKGLNGRALFGLSVDEPGLYRLHCFNANVRSDKEVPADDCIVFLKTPSTRAQALRVRQRIHLVGVAVTVGLAMGLYILHGVALHRRRSRPDPTAWSGPPQPQPWL